MSKRVVILRQKPKAKLAPPTVWAKLGGAPATVLDIKSSNVTPKPAEGGGWGCALKREVLLSFSARETLSSQLPAPSFTRMVCVGNTTLCYKPLPRNRSHGQPNGFRFRLIPRKVPGLSANPLGFRGRPGCRPQPCLAYPSLVFLLCGSQPEPAPAVIFLFTWLCVCSSMPTGLPPGSHPAYNQNNALRLVWPGWLFCSVALRSGEVPCRKPAGLPQASGALQRPHNSR